MTNGANAHSRPNGLDMPTASQETAEPARFVPGQPDMWAFVLFEALLFTAYFTVYIICRTRSVDLFLQSQAHLDLRVGGFNTLVLLASSWSVARCAQAARERSFRAALTNAFLTMLFGFSVPRLEGARVGEGDRQGVHVHHQRVLLLLLLPDGLHFLHLLIGFVFLGIVVYQLWSPARRSQELVETGATYWHTIDFLWILIFALLYVMR